MPADNAKKPAHLAIVGCYPPPYGGVGTHTRRLCNLLDKEGIDYFVYDATSPRIASAEEKGPRVKIVSQRRALWLAGYLFTAKEPCIYIMSRRLSSWIVGALMAVLRRKRVMVRLQNAELIDYGKHSWRRRLAGLALKRVHGVVCVNQKLAATVKELGVPENRVHWFPGFLPPSKTELARDQVAPVMWDFSAKHDPFIVSNGKISIYHGVDKYGLDLLVELTGRLASDYPNLGLGILFWDFVPGHQARLDELRARARELGVEDRILFHTQQGLFVPILNQARLSIRATNTDGDASSIRESLSLGVPAVVSDAAKRPDGAILFANRDLDDLETKVRAVLESDADSTYLNTEEDQQRVRAYLELIHRFLDGKEG